MSGKRFTDEFKLEAVKQVTERGYSVADVSSRLGISDNSLYLWLKKFDTTKESKQTKQFDELEKENRKLKAELRRITEEREILKKAAAYFARESD